jgi:hypothetical protein
MTPRYAVTAEKEEAPTAVFLTFEDALSWATLRFGPGAFHIAPVLTSVSPPPATPRPPG